jgi:hypothetical protein
MNYAEMYAKTYSEGGSAAIRRREQQWESQDVLRTLKRESLRFYEQQSWDKLSEIDAERRKLAWRRQEMRWRDQDTIRLMHRLKKRKSDSQSLLCKPLPKALRFGDPPVTESDISIICQ